IYELFTFHLSKKIEENSDFDSNNIGKIIINISKNLLSNEIYLKLTEKSRGIDRMAAVVDMTHGNLFE
ncbi:hypothetical protein KZ422_09095, partial [Glaesserella parasuis]|nr:hypothetical protein [Glaesserella parasuis]